MGNKKLLWIILLQQSKQESFDFDLTKLNDIALSFNFDTEFAIIADDKTLANAEELKLDTSAFYSVNVYDSKVKLNTRIMKKLQDTTADNVIVTGSNYLKYESIMKSMLSAGSKDGVNFVHLKYQYNGFFTEVTSLTSKIYNKVVKMFTGSNDRLFIRNCVMFNKVVIELMQDFPNNSGIIRETNFLACTDNVEINVDKNFKKSKWKMNSIKLFISSLILGILSIALFVVICAVKMNFDLLFWLLIVFIITSIVSVITLNYSILKDKISIDNFYDEEVQAITAKSYAVYNTPVIEEEKVEEIKNDNVVQENIEPSQEKDTPATTKTKSKPSNKTTTKKSSNDKGSKTTKTPKSKSSTTKKSGSSKTTAKSSSTKKTATTNKKSSTASKSTTTKTKSTTSKTASAKKATAKKSSSKK